MKPIVRVIALIAGLLVLIAAPAGAAPTQPKEEVVYAHLASDGKVNRVFVVNAFADAEGDLTDYGHYTGVVNLSNTDELDLREDRVKVPAQSEPFYYQGELAEQDMPWRLGLEYRLDGRTVTANELLGRSGAFELRVKVRANEEVDPVFFDHYMLQIQVNMDSQHFTEIISDGATIASAGQNRVVNLTSLPGNEADLVIRAQASDAVLGQIQVVGLPFEMMFELPDPAQYTADLLTLQSAIAELATGVTGFTDGVQAVTGAADELSGGAATLASNAELIAGGFDQLAVGRGDFDAALRQYSQGVQDFATGLGGLNTGIGEFASGVDALATGSGELASGLDEYDTGMGQFSAGLGQSAQGGQALVAGLDQLAGGLGQLTEQGKYADENLVGASEEILGSLQALQFALQAPLNADEAAQLTQLLDGFSAAFEGFAGAVGTTDFDALATALNGSAASVGQSAGSIEQVAADLQDEAGITTQLGIDVTDNPQAQALLAHMAAKGSELADTASQLRTVEATLAGLAGQVEALRDSLTLVSDQFDAIRGLIQRVGIAITAISPEQIGQLQAGVGELVGGYTEFHYGLVAYVDGVEGAYHGLAGNPADPTQPAVLPGAEQLSDGLTTLDGSGQELATAAGELATGAGQLNQGLLGLQAGVGQFSGQAGQIVDGAGQLASGGAALLNGHGQLVAGEAQFGSGLGQYADGMSTFGSGMSQFAQGAGELGAAAPQLADGAGQLRDATSDMDQQMADQIDEALAEFMPGEFELASFTDSRNTGIERVQFIYLVDTQTEPEPAAEPEPVESRSWWQRIIDIFR